MPIVVAVGPGGEWQKATWSVGSVKFGIGDFVAAAINFGILGFVPRRTPKIFIQPAPATPTTHCQTGKRAGRARGG